MSESDPHTIRKQQWRKGELMFLEALRVRAEGHIELADRLDEGVRRHVYAQACETLIKIIEMKSST